MRLLARFLASALVALAVSTADAADHRWSTKRFVYRADGKKISEVFQDFAASQSLPIVVDATVEGVVNGEFNSKPEAFLDAMSKTYGLVWYFDGVTLFVYPSRTMASRVFRMRGYTRQQVQQMLTSLGLGDPRFPLRFSDADQTLLAYGPPRHLELVQTVVDTLDGGARDEVGKSIQVFPLHYAVAADRTTGGSRLPGLASTLNNLFSGSAPLGGAGSLPATPLAAAVASPARSQTDLLRSAVGVGAAHGPSAESKDGVRDASGRLVNTESAAASVDSERPFFQADEGTNSIIVRGTPERMKQYESLIHQLDVHQDVVELEATIIDVDTDDFNALGIDWNFTGRHARISVSPGSFSGGSSSTTLPPANITTLVGDAGHQLLSHILALQGGGKARIVARPKVLASVNRTATMSDKRIVSVRVSGNLNVNLFKVEPGTTLQVVPQVIALPDRKQVRLTLFIQDGSLESNQVDSIPIVQQTEITTEATLREGESLLIGGISVESTVHDRSGLPGLSRIPFLGALFRTDQTSVHRTERLFLITPKIVDTSGEVRATDIDLPAPSSLGEHEPISNAAPTVGPAPAATAVDNGAVTDSSH